MPGSQQLRRSVVRKIAGASVLAAVSAGAALAPSAALADDGTANIAPIVCVDSKQGCLKYLKASSSASKLVTKTLTCRPGDMRCRTRLLGLVEDAAATREAERVFADWLDRYRELPTLEGQLADVAAELGLDEAGLTELLARFDLPKQPGSLKTRLLGALAAWGLQGGRSTGDARADMKNMLGGLAAAAAQDRLRMPFGAAADYSENGITWIDSAWGQWGYTSNDVSGQPSFFAFTVTPGTARSGTINVMEPIWVFGDPKSEGGDAGTGGTDAGSGTGGTDSGTGTGTGTDGGTGTGGTDGGTGTGTDGGTDPTPQPGGTELGDYGDTTPPDTAVVQPVNCSDGMSDSCMSRDPWVGVVFAADANSGVTDPAYEATIDGVKLTIVWGGGYADPSGPDFSTYTVLGSPNPLADRNSSVTDPVPFP